MIYNAYHDVTGSDSEEDLVDIYINDDIFISYTSEDTYDWYRYFNRIMSIRDIPNDKVYIFYKHKYCTHPDDSYEN